MKIDLTLSIYYDEKHPTSEQIESIRQTLYYAMDHLASEGLLSPEDGPYIDTWGITQYNETWGHI